MAAIIATNAWYLLLTFLPPIIWLLFYLREDEHPEPKRLIVVTFIGGVIIAIPAAAIEYFSVQLTGGTTNIIREHALTIFAAVALIEEYGKYFVVRYLIEMRPEFDEPIDAMIYMMSSAIGFAAIENALFVFPIFHGEFLQGLELIAGRFLGANLLHVLASGIFGFFLARALLSPHLKKPLILTGLLIATILHTAFNYLIIIQGGLSEGFSYVILFLALLALIVFTEFARLKRKRVNFEK